MPDLWAPRTTPHLHPLKLEVAVRPPRCPADPAGLATVTEVLPFHLTAGSSRRLLANPIARAAATEGKLSSAAERVAKAAENDYFYRKHLYRSNIRLPEQPDPNRALLDAIVSEVTDTEMAIIATAISDLDTSWIGAHFTRRAMEAGRISLDELLRLPIERADSALLLRQTPACANRVDELNALFGEDTVAFAFLAAREESRIRRNVSLGGWLTTGRTLREVLAAVQTMSRADGAVDAGLVLRAAAGLLREHQQHPRYSDACEQGRVIADLVDFAREFLQAAGDQDAQALAVGLLAKGATREYAIACAGAL